MEDELIKHIIARSKLLDRGAESILYRGSFLGLDAVIKYRPPKKYRISELDTRLRRIRTYREASILSELYNLGVPVPKLYYVSLRNYVIIMEYINGVRLRELLLDRKALGKASIGEIARLIGAMVAELHNHNIIHGDLTTANMILPSLKDKKIYLLDFGLADKSPSAELKAVDIELFYRVLHSTHADISSIFFKEFMREYLKNVNGSVEIYKRFLAIRRMGRYVERRRETQAKPHNY